MLLRRGVSTLLIALALSGARAAPMSPGDVPEPLQGWIGWTLHGHEHVRCVEDDTLLRLRTVPAT